MSGNMTKYQNGTGLIADENKEAGLSFFQIVLLSFTLISSVALVFSLVYFMLRKRALDELRHRLVPLYHFDPGECEDWEDEILEDYKKEILRSDHKKFNYTSISNPTGSFTNHNTGEKKKIYKQ